MSSNDILIQALRKSAQQILENNNYHWGHMGQCNCGFLAQNLLKKAPGEIHQIALTGNGDWNDQIRDYCPNSGFPMDSLIFDLIQFGIKAEELAELEKLSNPRILKETSKQKDYLEFNQKEDVALYMYTWAELIENESLRKFESVQYTPEENLVLV